MRRRHRPRRRPRPHEGPVHPPEPRPRQAPIHRREDARRRGDRHRRRPARVGRPRHRLRRHRPPRDQARGAVRPRAAPACPGCSASSRPSASTWPSSSTSTARRRASSRSRTSWRRSSARSRTSSTRRPSSTSSREGEAFRVDGTFPLHELRDKLGLEDEELEAADVDTVGGYVIRELGRWPRVGDSVKVGPYTARVAALGNRQRRVAELLISPPPVNRPPRLPRRRRQRQAWQISRHVPRQTRPPQPRQRRRRPPLTAFTSRRPFRRAEAIAASTHAPEKGRPGRTQRRRGAESVEIHAPAEGRLKTGY